MIAIMMDQQSQGFGDHLSLYEKKIKWEVAGNCAENCQRMKLM
jgi:hypothetical protein